MISRKISSIVLLFLCINLNAQVCFKHINTSTVGDISIPKSSPNKIVSADFNTDEKADLAVIYNESISHVTVLLGNGAGGFGSEINLPSNNPISDITTSDYNNDQKADIAIVSINNLEYEISVYLGDGKGAFSSVKTTQITPTSMSLVLYSMVSADFNSDGKIDLAIESMSDGISILLGDGKGSFASPQSFFAKDGFSDKMVVADFNNDKNLDIACSNMLTDSLFVYLGKGNGLFNSSPIKTKLSYQMSSIAVGDFNADGIIDLVEIGFSNTSIYKGTGNGSFIYSEIAVNTSGDNQAASCVDFNSDGKIDIAICSRTYGLVLLLGNGNCTFKTPQFWDSDASSIVTADFDSDKKMDISVIHGLYDRMLTDNIWVYLKAIPPLLDLGSNENICSKNPKLLDAGSGFNYIWNDGSKNQTLLASKSGTYTVTITDNNMCTNIDSISIQVSKAHAELNALATVFDNNRVVFGWERTSGQNTVSYKVLRETDVAGVFSIIGSKLFKEDSYVVDSNVKVLQQTYRYKLRTFNSCGDSAESPIHKTMLVQVGYNKATGLNSLSWNGYEGIPLSTYRVFKNKIEITSLAASSSNNMYAINDPGLQGDVYYISYDLPDSIYTTKVKADSGPFSVSLSNMAESELVGNRLILWDDNFLISPNPAKMNITISSQLINETYCYGQLLNSIGQIIRKFEIVKGDSQTIDVSQLTSGLYQVQLITENTIISKSVIISK